MARLAFMTLGVLLEPAGHPRVQGFVDRIDKNFAAADSSDGFIGRSTFDAAIGQETWGVWVVPSRFQRTESESLVAQTLSLWRDLESVFAYAYYTRHAEALGQRKEWFVEARWPNHLAWWVGDDHTPSWHEACQRYDRLDVAGDSPDAFDLRHPFGPDGQPARVDRDVARLKVAKLISAGRQNP